MRLLSLVSTLILFSTLAFAGIREITVETASKDGKTIWSPETIEVTQGEKVKFIVKHELTGGKEFHGFFIPELKIQTKVDRNKPVTIAKTIPKALEAKTYKVQCQFHEAHVPATLVVKAK